MKNRLYTNLGYFLAIAICIMLIVLVPETQASAAPSVGFTDQSGSIGETIDVPLVAKNFSNTIGGITINIGFDQTKLSFTGYTAGVIPTSGDTLDFNSPTAGTLAFNWFAVSNFLDWSSDATLLTLHFNIVATGKTNVNLTFINTNEIADSIGDPVGGVSFTAGTIALNPAGVIPPVTPPTVTPPPSGGSTGSSGSYTPPPLVFTSIFPTTTKQPTPTTSIVASTTTFTTTTSSSPIISTSTGVYFNVLPITSTIKRGKVMKYSYIYKNITGKPQTVKISRQMINGKGKAVFTASAVTTLKKGASFTRVVKDAISSKLPIGDYIIKVKILTTKNKLISEDYFDFTVVK